MVNSGINKVTNQRMIMLTITINRPIVKTIKGPERNFKIGLIIELAKAKTKPVIRMPIKSPLKIIPGTKRVAINIPTELANILTIKRRSKRIFI